MAFDQYFNEMINNIEPAQTVDLTSVLDLNVVVGVFTKLVSVLSDLPTVAFQVTCYLSLLIVM